MSFPSSWLPLLTLPRMGAGCTHPQAWRCGREGGQGASVGLEELLYFALFSYGILLSVLLG